MAHLGPMEYDLSSISEKLNESELVKNTTNQFLIEWCNFINEQIIDMLHQL